MGLAQNQRNLTNEISLITNQPTCVIKLCQTEAVSDLTPVQAELHGMRF